MRFKIVLKLEFEDKYWQTYSYNLNYKSVNIEIWETDVKTLSLRDSNIKKLKSGRSAILLLSGSRKKAFLTLLKVKLC